MPLFVTVEHLRKIVAVKERHDAERAELEERHYQEMAELGLLVWATNSYLKRAIQAGGE